MLRKLVIASLVAGAFAAPARAQAQPELLMPGVSYQRLVQYTLHGPVGVNVLTVTRPGGLLSVLPVLSNEQIDGTETLTAIEQRLSPSATVAAVSGDLVAACGRPDGLLIRNGAVDHGPRTARTSVGIDTSGTLRLDRITLFGYWQGTGTRRSFTLVNEPPRPGTVSLFTPAWGPLTPGSADSVAVVLRPFPPATPNADLVGTSVQLVPGGVAGIPPDGAVLVGRGSAASALQGEAAPGQTVHVRLTLQPDWTGVTGALGGGPLLVRSGRPVFAAGESIPPELLALPQPRVAVGQRADGSLLLVSVEGGVPGYSFGLTNYELAQTLVRLGAVSGAALGAGGPAEMAFDGRVLGAPVRPEPQLADALAVEYAGVYAPPPSAPVLSPNGDGVGETETLAYKVVRPSTVTVALVGPDGVPRLSSQGQVAPGTYPVQWSGRRADGTPEQEGLWRFTVSAVDDLGRASSVERDFTLDLTLGHAKAIGPPLAAPRASPRPVASFQLTRPATVAERIETRTGTIVRTFPTVRAAAGTLTISWDGRTASGGAVYPGRYVARATATTAIGTVDLAAAITVRRRAAK